MWHHPFYGFPVHEFRAPKSTFLEKNQTRYFGSKVRLFAQKCNFLYYSSDLLSIFNYIYRCAHLCIDGSASIYRWPHLLIDGSASIYRWPHLFIDAAASIYRWPHLLIDAAMYKIDSLKLNLLSNGLIEKFWDALWLGIWPFLCLTEETLDLSLIHI